MLMLLLLLLLLLLGLCDGDCCCGTRVALLVPPLLSVRLCKRWRCAHEELKVQSLVLANQAADCLSAPPANHLHGALHSTYMCVRACVCACARVCVCAN